MASRTKNPRIPVSRSGKVIGEYHPLQMGSLLETGHLKNDDLCQDPDTAGWVSIKDFLQQGRIPEYSRKHSADTGPYRDDRRGQPVGWMSGWMALACGLIVLLALSVAIFWSGKVSVENAELKSRLERAEAAGSEWKQKYENVLFAAREVATSGLVRGKVIIRDVSGKRVTLPGIKVSLYSRPAIEAFLSDRFARISEAGGTDPGRLAEHFLKNLPLPIETTTTDSDGRFECTLPEAGEYVIQTSMRSADSGILRLWFVTFDSRDPLNTPVDITESNAVQQFNPVFMLVGGR